MKDTEKAARVTGPKGVADVSARTGVQRHAVTSTQIQITLPTTGKEKNVKSTIGKRWIRLLALGSNVQWSEGHGAATTVVYNQASATGTGHASAGATLIDSVPEQVMISSECTHLTFICPSGGTGFVEFHISDQPVV